MKRGVALLLAASMMLSLTACSGSSKSQTKDSAASETTKALNIADASGAKKTNDHEGTAESVTAAERVIDETKSRVLIVGTDIEPDCQVPFNPDLGYSNTENEMSCNIYEGAYKVMPGGTVEPLLADSYEVNDDRTEWTIHFKDGITFSNGDPLEMEDVIWSYDQFAVHKSTKSMWANYDHTEKIDDRTVKIVLSAPYIPLMLSAIAGRCGLILNKGYYDEVGLEGYTAAPVGTGPYILTEVKTQDRQVYEKNQNYWNIANNDAFYEKITLRFLKDQNTQMLALENNEIDVLLNAKLSPLLMLPDSSDIEFDIAQSAGPMVAYLNENNGICSNIDFRRALASCVDRDAISLVLYDGYATPSYYHGCDFFTDAPKDEDITVKLPEYDLEKAKEYLKAANYNGEEFVIVCTSGSIMEQAAQVLQGELLKVGVNCEVKSLDSASVTATVKLPEGWNMWMHRANSSAMDFSWQRNFLSARYKEKTQSAETYQFLHYDEKWEDLLDTTDSIFDHEKRAKVFADMQNIINEEVRCIPLINTFNVVAYHDRVKGIVGRPIEYLVFFSEWY